MILKMLHFLSYSASLGLKPTLMLFSEVPQPENLFAKYLTYLNNDNLGAFSQLICLSHVPQKSTTYIPKLSSNAGGRVNRMR